MKLIKEFLKDRYTLWLIRFTLLMGLYLSAFNDITGYFLLVVFVGWYIAVMILDNYSPTNKDYLSKVCTIYRRSERVEIKTSIGESGEIDPLFKEDINIPFLEGVN